MADGRNELRAILVTEVLNGFRAKQLQIAQIRPQAPPAERNEYGYVALAQCHADAQRNLAGNPGLAPSTSTPSSPEQAKAQLQRVLLDASARRFKAHRILLKVRAIQVWVNRRRQILNGQSPQPSHRPALQQAETTLRTELTAITDQRVFNELRASDAAATHWTDEMPALPQLLTYIRTH